MQRNQRPKGIKTKHVLRICLLISACCWLIFQIKRSHYKHKDLESVDTNLSRSNNNNEVIILGRKDLQPRETAMHEEKEEEDEIDENEQYEFDDEEAREEHYKADDASSAVTDEHEDQTLDNIKFLEMGILENENQVHNGAKIQETGSKSVNVSLGHSRYGFDSTRVVEESKASLKITNMSGVVEPQTTLTEDADDVQHDAIDSTDFIRLDELDKL